MTASNVEEIRRLQKEESELAVDLDINRWEQAWLIAAELDSGKTQRALADEINRSQSHVSFMARVFRDYHGNHDGQSFDECYQQVKRPTRAEPAPWRPSAPAGTAHIPATPEDLLAGLAKSVLNTAFYQAEMIYIATAQTTAWSLIGITDAQKRLLHHAAAKVLGVLQAEGDPWPAYDEFAELVKMVFNLPADEFISTDSLLLLVRPIN